MKKPSLYAAGASLVYFVSALCIPAAVGALPDSPLVISEVQPGSTESASEEFIELFNVSDKPIDLDANHWQLTTASASAKDWTPYRTAMLHGIINPGESYLIGSIYTTGGQSVHYLSSLADATFTAGMTATGGHVQLAYTTNGLLSDGTCGPANTVADRVEWSTVTSGVYGFPSITGRATYPIFFKSGITPPHTLQRLFDTTYITYADTDNDALDFTLTTATPRMSNIPMALRTSAFNLLPLPPIADSCDPNQPLPSPGTGPAEPSDTSPPPTDDVPDGDIPGDGTIDDGQSGGTPLVNDGLAPPRITELLPNPASPQTDAADEFVELFNPNEAAYNLSGYIVEAGGATLRRYIMPEGSVLQPHAYLALFSKDTGLSLPNTSGSARLLDTAGVVVMQVSPYENAPDGQSWMATETGWQWTTTPTPNIVNTLVALLPATKKPAAVVTKQTTKKTTAVKAASTAKPKAKATTAKEKKAKAATTKTQLSTVSATARNPVHTGVLAAIGVFALLYGAYEYRHDMANKIHQFRSNRAARRAARQAAAGR